MKLQVNWQLEHNGTVYPAGATIELDEKKDKATIEQLGGLGVVTDPSVKPAEAQ